MDITNKGMATKKLYSINKANKNCLFLLLPKVTPPRLFDFLKKYHLCKRLP